MISFFLKKWLLNPEIGLTLQKHIHGNNNYSNDNIEFSTVDRWPIIVGLSPNISLKYQFQNKNTLGIGFNAIMPFYSINVGEYEMLETRQVENMKSRCAYFMLAVSYDFSYTKIRNSTKHFF